MQGNSQYDEQYDQPSSGFPLIEEQQKANALMLKWTLGFNFSLLDSVHNLTNEYLGRKEIFYVSAHTGVIYDYENNTQRLLQGHCNKITCTSYCIQEDILVTCDCGPDSMMVVWDVKTGIPKKTIFDPHPFGTQAVDISPDGIYIVTISREESEANRQTISLWSWSEDKKPLVTTELDPRLGDYQFHIKFNPDTQRELKEFATTGKQRVVFWSWEKGVKGFEFYAPASDQKKMQTQTAFIPSSTQAVTGTTDGFIIVWDISLIMEDYSQPEERRGIKVVNLINQQSALDTGQKKSQVSINILKVQNEYLVIGASNGGIRFYDFQFRIIAWFEDIGISSITSISFAVGSSKLQESIKIKQQEDKDEDFKQINVEDFIVIDIDAKINLLKDSLFEEFDSEKKKGQLIIQSLISPIVSIACMPSSSILAISCKNGWIYEWNINEKQAILLPFRKNFEDKIPTNILYSPDGKYFSIATQVGLIFVYDNDKNDGLPTILQISAEQDKLKTPVIHQVYANDSKHLATVDKMHGVCLFKYAKKYEDEGEGGTKDWIFAGKVRCHSREITSIAFGESVNKPEKRLYTIGMDKMMFEYDVINSNSKDGLIVLSSIQIEQECNPTSCAWYPINQFNSDILLTTNEDYKIKLWQCLPGSNYPKSLNILLLQINFIFKVCRKTCLGPVYGYPINKLLVLNPSNAKTALVQSYLAYSTKEKIVGLIKLPMEGNPNHTMGLIAHPGKITDISSTSDGQYLITSGGDDFAVNIWEVDVKALEINFKAQDDQMLDTEENPFSHFLEGGPHGQTHQDLKNFFYYAQIRAKNEHSTKARKLDGKVPINHIAEMMRAMGFYPTNKEIENMQNEIKYSEYDKFDKKSGEQTTPYVNEMDIDKFLKLFINHRPVYGITRAQLEESVAILEERPIVQKEDFINKEEKGPQIERQQLSRQEFIEILQKEGEKMTPPEIKGNFRLLNILYEDGEEGLKLPLSIEELIDVILGFEDLDKDENIIQEQQDENEQQLQEEAVS